MMSAPPSSARFNSSSSWTSDLHVVGNTLCHIDDRIQADLKCLKVAAIHSNDVRAALKRALQFFFVMDFTQGIQIQDARVIQQPTKRSIIQGGENQQDGVGVMSAGLGNLKFIDNEIFAQAWQLSSGRSLKQVGQRSMKELFVGKHRQRGCSTASQ